jgi:hypothetical protein
MVAEPKRQEPDIPPQKPDIQPEPSPEEIPQDKNLPEKESPPSDEERLDSPFVCLTDVTRTSGNNGRI